MKIRTLIQILLIVTGTFSVVSTAMQSPGIELYVKPMTVPLFFMLYWFNVKKLDVLFLVILFLCFLGDVFLLTKIDNSFMFVLLSYSLCYIILFYYLFYNHQSFDYSKSDIIYLLVFIVVWTYVVYEIFNAVESSMGSVRPYGLVYLAILYLLLIGAVFQYINIRSPRSLWFLIAILNFVISDSCYALDKFYLPSLELKIINSIYQLLAVFFLVKFKIASATPLKLK